MHDLADRIAVLVVHGSRARHGLTDLQGRVTFSLIDTEAAAVAAAGGRQRGKGVP